MFSRNKKYLEKANFLPLLEVDIYQYKRKKKKTTKSGYLHTGVSAAYPLQYLH